MIPFNPASPMALWYLAWRQHIRDAKAHPEQLWGYCRAAAIAQTQYLCYMAQELVEEPYK